MKQINFFIVFLFAVLFSMQSFSQKLEKKNARNSKENPTIVISPFMLSFENVVVGESSLIKSYTLTATALTEPVTITCSEDFYVSLTQMGEFSQSITVPALGGNILKTIYISFRPSKVGLITGLIEHTSLGATTRNLIVGGSGVDVSVPNIIIAPLFMSFTDNQINENSIEQNFSLQTTQLTENVFITAPDGFLISTTSNANYVSSLELTPVDGVITKTIYVVFHPTEVKAYAGSISLKSTGAANKSIAVLGNGVDNFAPQITVTPMFLDLGEMQIPMRSFEKTYQVEAVNLKENMTLTASANFLIASTSDGDFSNTLILTPDLDGNISTTIYVVFEPTMVQTYTGSVTHISLDATQRTIYLTGVGIDMYAPEITVLPAFITFPATLLNQTSEPKQYEINAVNLTEDLTVTASDGFEISQNQVDYVNTLTINNTGTINTIVYIRFKPTAVNLYSNVIRNQSTGITSDVYVSGVGATDAVYIVVFNITAEDGTTPFENAEIIFNEQTLYSDKDGIATFENVSPGIYSYSVTFNGFETINSTTAVIDQDIYIYEQLVVTSISDINFDSNITVSPNPSNGVYYINTNDHKILNISVTDISGREVYKGNNNDDKITLDLNNLPGGIYFLILKTEDKSFSTKIIKNNR